MGKITIVKTSLSYEWTPLELNLSRVNRYALMTNENWAEDDGNRMLFTQNARREMFEFIQWKNMNTSVNRTEQGGLLAGRHYSVPGYHGKVCLVTHVFPLHDAASTRGYLDASAEDWHKAYALMDQMPARTGERLEALGWFHTHPNDLPTFMSGTDRTTQGKIFSGEYSYALVLNPHTGSWKAYRSKDVLDAACMMLSIDDIGLLCGTDSAETELCFRYASRVDGRKMRRRNLEKAQKWVRAGMKGM